MALVGEIVARFKAETTDYVQKLDQAKAKNKDLAAELLKTAGSADKAIATLNSAKKANALGELGIDPRAMSGVVAQIKSLDKEAQHSTDSAKKLAQELKAGAKEAKGYDNVAKSLESFSSGNILKGIVQLKKGLASIGQEGGGIPTAIGVGLIAIAGKQIAELGDKIKDAVGQWREGKKSTGELVEDLAAGVPILGNWWKLGRDIKEIFSDEAQLQKKQLQSLNELIAASESLHKANEKIREDRKKQQEEQDRQGETADVLNLRTGGQNSLADLRDIQNESKNALAKTREEIDKDFQAKENAAKNALAAAQRAGDENTITATKRQLEQIAGQWHEAQKAAGEAAAKLFEAKVNAKFFGKPGATDEQAAQIEDAKALAKKLAEKISSSIEATLKGNPIVNWVEKQFKDLEKQGEKFKKIAEQIKEKIKTPQEKFTDELNEAITAKGFGQLSQGELSKFFNKDNKDLLKEKKGILDSEKAVYHLPDVKDIRAGQVLFNAPHKLEEKQLQRLEEIRDELKTLNDKSEDNGITLQEIN